jgi:hypothetical protein
VAGNNGSIPPTKPKGSKNKINGEAKRLVLEALETVGGVDWLIALAKHEPRSFASIIQKLIPSEIAAKVESDVVLKLNVHRYADAPEDQDEKDAVTLAEEYSGRAIQSLGPAVRLDSNAAVDRNDTREETSPSNGRDAPQVPGIPEEVPSTPLDRTTLTEGSRRLLFEPDSDFDHPGPPGEGLSDTEDPSAPVESERGECTPGAEDPPANEG